MILRSHHIFQRFLSLHSGTLIGHGQSILSMRCAAIGRESGGFSLCLSSLFFYRVQKTRPLLRARSATLDDRLESVEPFLSSPLMFLHFPRAMDVLFFYAEFTIAFLRALDSL